MNPMSHIKLCAFADEADASRLGQIKALSENAIPYLEIRGVDGINIANLSHEAALQFKSELDAAGIRVWSIGSPAGKTPITGDFEQDIAQFKHLLEMADIFEISGIRRIRYIYIPQVMPYFRTGCTVALGLCWKAGIYIYCSIYLSFFN